MTPNHHAQLRADLAKLRSVLVPSEFGPIPESIQRLMSMLAQAPSLEEKMELYPLLLSECSRARNDQLEIAVLRRQVEDLPDDPLSLASLAFGLALKRSTTGWETESAGFAQQALAMAKSQDRQVKYCGTNLARVSLMRNDYDQLEIALRDLIEDAGTERDEDYGPEFDFLSEVDESRVSPQLLTAFKKLQSRGK